jgi:hypothetical protein
MKTKALSLTLAGIMSLQSIGFSNPDRTVGIGEQAITTAKGNLKSLNQEILLLDQSLAKAAAAITNRDHSGGVTNGFAVAGAGIGLALSVMANVNMRKGGEGTLYNVLFAGVFSIAASVSSMAFGLTSQALKTGVNTKEIEAQLIEAQKNVQAAITQAANDKTISTGLTQLAFSIKNTQESLASYQDQETEVSRNRLASQASQLVGAALIAFGFTQRESIVPAIGAVVMSAGSLAAVLSGFQGSEAKTILIEIQKTRDLLKDVSTALQ